MAELDHLQNLSPKTGMVGLLLLKVQSPMALQERGILQRLQKLTSLLQNLYCVILVFVFSSIAHHPWEPTE
jgi:hypothetical protein